MLALERVEFAAAEPVTGRPLPTALESRFWKLRTATLSPPEISAPTAAARLTVERPDTERTTSVLLPVPPSITTASGPVMIVSLSGPPTPVSMRVWASFSVVPVAPLVWSQAR